MSLEKLHLEVSDLEQHITNHYLVNPKISKGAIGWHIDHSLKVINNVSLALKTSDPETYKNNFTFLGKVFFALRFFPRGKAKAPQWVRPPEIILKTDLLSQLDLAKTNINALSNADKNAYFKHPLFGHINRTRVYHFLAMHTHHHIKIINDIMEA